MSSDGTEIQTHWTNGPSVPLNPSAAVAAADLALKRYAEVGIQLPPANRLQRARKFLERFTEGGVTPSPTDSELLRLVFEATQSCFEHYLISRATSTGTGRITLEHARKIRQSLLGSDLARKDMSSLGRDTQFELYAGALLAMGGVPVRIAEPDLMFIYNEQEVGLAAKRVKSIKKLRRRFKEAAEQIARTGKRGFVAINADLLVTDIGLYGSPTERGARFNERLSLLERLDEEFSTYPFVAGRFAFGTDALWDFSGERPLLEIGFFRQLRVYTADADEIEQANRFYEGFNALIEERMQRL